MIYKMIISLFAFSYQYFIIKSIGKGVELL